MTPEQLDNAIFWINAATLVAAIVAPTLVLFLAVSIFKGKHD